MKTRNLAVLILIFIASIGSFFPSCKKLNDYTDVGSGLIPPVDNINTFDTVMDVQVFNNIFSNVEDSLRTSPTDLHYLGLINNDPLFGKTDGRLYLQLKPPSYPYSFATDTVAKLQLDSVVLILSYINSYGDSTVSQTVNVYELNPTIDFKTDSNYLVRQDPFAGQYSNLLGSKTFVPMSLNDSVKAFGDTTSNQLRIRLNSTFGNRLLAYDSASTGAYFNDSLFRSKFAGFALQSMNTGNALMGFELPSTNTQLAVYYKYSKGSVVDSSTVSYFGYSMDLGTQSASANYIKRDYAGTPLLAAQGGATSDPYVFIQNSPGTYATLKIPGLATLSNRVIHRAELIMEEGWDVSDTIFKTPDVMYIDAYDPTILSAIKYRAIPYDLSFDRSDAYGVPQNLASLGIVAFDQLDQNGKNIKVWRMNMSRYLQHVVNGTAPAYDFRIYSPFLVKNTIFSEAYSTVPSTSDYATLFALNSVIASGRVRLVGSSGIGDPNPRKMRLHIVYSKL